MPCINLSAYWTILGNSGFDQYLNLSLQSGTMKKIYLNLFLKAILKHHKVVSMRGNMLFTIFKYLF